MADLTKLQYDTANDKQETNSIDISSLSVEGLVEGACACKERGNLAFKKGFLLAKHTAGKDALADACFQVSLL